MSSTFQDSSNSLLKKFQLNELTGTYGYSRLWKIYSALENSTKSPASLLIFDKRQHTKNDLKLILPFLEKDCSNLIKIKHPNFPRILHPLSSSRYSLILAIERVQCSLADLIEVQNTSIGRSECLLGIFSILEALSFLINDLKLCHLAVSPQSILITPNFEFKLGYLSHVEPIIEGFCKAQTLFEITHPSTCSFYPFPPLDMLPPEYATSSPAVIDPEQYTSWQIGALLVRFIPSFHNLKLLSHLFSVQIEALRSTNSDPMAFNQYVSRISSIAQIIKSEKQIVDADPLFSLISRCLERDCKRRPGFESLKSTNCFHDGLFVCIRSLKFCLNTRDYSSLNNNLLNLFKFIPTLDVLFLKRNICPIISELLQLRMLVSTEGEKIKKKGQKDSIFDRFKGFLPSENSLHLTSVTYAVADKIPLIDFTKLLLPNFLPIIFSLCTVENLIVYKHLVDLICKRLNFLFDSVKIHDASLLSSLFVKFFLNLLSLNDPKIVRASLDRIPSLLDTLSDDVIQSNFLPQVLTLLNNPNSVAEVQSACLLVFTKIRRNILTSDLLMSTIVPNCLSFILKKNRSLTPNVVTTLIVVLGEICKDLVVPSYYGTVILPAILPLFATSSLSKKQTEVCSKVVENMLTCLTLFQIDNSMVNSSLETEVKPSSQVVESSAKDEEIIKENKDLGVEGVDPVDVKECSDDDSNGFLLDSFEPPSPANRRVMDKKNAHGASLEVKTPISNNVNTSLFDLDDDDFLKF
ncbi:hypothetical protein RCL1_005329 [Eukaryota sp. TZLM3-RCL]